MPRKHENIDRKKQAEDQLKYLDRERTKQNETDTRNYTFGFYGNFLKKERPSNLDGMALPGAKQTAWNREGNLYVGIIAGTLITAIGVVGYIARDTLKDLPEKVMKQLEDPVVPQTDEKRFAELQEVGITPKAWVEGQSSFTKAYPNLSYQQAAYIAEALDKEQSNALIRGQGDPTIKKILEYGAAPRDLDAEPPFDVNSFNEKSNNPKVKELIETIGKHRHQKREKLEKEQDQSYTPGQNPMLQVNLAEYMAQEAEANKSPAEKRVEALEAKLERLREDGAKRSDINVTRVMLGEARKQLTREQGNELTRA